MPNKMRMAVAGHTKGQAMLTNDAAARFALHIHGVINRPILDVHVVDHCNLNCASCNHFAPIAQKRFLSLDGFERDLALLARIDGIDSFFDSVYLMGGEPLLHPQIADIVMLTRRYLPTTNLYVATNGLCLASMPSEFWLACEQARVTVSLTRYPIDVDYNGLQALAEQHGVRAQAHGKVVAGRQTFSFRRTPMDSSGVHDPSRNYIHCPSGGYCLQLRDGRIYPCHRAAYMETLNKWFATSFSHDANDYLELQDVSSLDEIDAFRRTPKPVCRYCAPDETEVLPWARSQRIWGEWLTESSPASAPGT